MKEKKTDDEGINIFWLIIICGLLVFSFLLLVDAIDDVMKNKEPLLQVAPSKNNIERR